MFKKSILRTFVLALFIATVAPQPQAQAAVSWWKVTLAAVAVVMAGAYWWLTPSSDALFVKAETLNEQTERLVGVTQEKDRKASSEEIMQNTRETYGTLENYERVHKKTIDDYESLKNSIVWHDLRCEHRNAVRNLFCAQLEQARGLSLKQEEDLTMLAAVRNDDQVSLLETTMGRVQLAFRPPTPAEEASPGQQAITQGSTFAQTSCLSRGADDRIDIAALDRAAPLL